jgi:hypothetical protein
MGEGTRPSQLRFNNGNHTYYDGKKWIPSVTGITGKIEDKGGLLDWSAKCVATLAIDEAAELSRRRRLEGDEEAYTWLWNAANRERDGKGTKGSDLHDVADRMLSGAPMPEYLDPNIKFMAENVAAFMVEYGVDAVHSEVRLCHRTLSYCGTTDQIGVVPQYGALPLIIDWKTSESMYRTPKFSHGKNAMQLTAYSHAEVMWWDDKSESDMLELNPEVGLIVMIRPEGYKVYEYDLVRSWPQFERALDNYHWWRGVDELTRGPIRPSGLVDNLMAAAASAESVEDLHALYQRAVHYDVWSDKLRAVFTSRRAHLEIGVAS